MVTPVTGLFQSLRMERRYRAQPWRRSLRQQAGRAADGSHSRESQKTQLARKDTPRTRASTQTTRTSMRITLYPRAYHHQDGRHRWADATACGPPLHRCRRTHRRCPTVDQCQVEAVRAGTTYNDPFYGASSARTGYAQHTTGRNQEPDRAHSHPRHSLNNGHGARASRAHTYRDKHRHLCRHRCLGPVSSLWARANAGAARVSQRPTAAQTTRQTARRSHRLARATRRCRA